MGYGKGIKPERLIAPEKVRPGVVYSPGKNWQVRAPLLVLGQCVQIYQEHMVSDAKSAIRRDYHVPYYRYLKWRLKYQKYFAGHTPLTLNELYRDLVRFNPDWEHDITLRVAFEKDTREPPIPMAYEMDQIFDPYQVEPERFEGSWTLWPHQTPYRITLTKYWPWENGPEYFDELVRTVVELVPWDGTPLTSRVGPPINMFFGDWWPYDG